MITVSLADFSRNVQKYLPEDTASEILISRKGEPYIKIVPNKEQKKESATIKQEALATPISNRLLGALSSKNISLDEIRAERLSKYE
ncbi:putative prevent-host-death family protein [Treponema primitia ZAS-2]|uniref:Putative prevent-host-death family protein n=1 Tax=Treponema primitia (strain ATCC BAA-887 / DSM 12427 / ZAS-2) TaxID=545694 RepID=F5YJI9_TREPZ|nr:type II toxin-antitoxin system prevent-host-death family antitoxin [Treponema primitia]AEF86165.1 putative prevent-host-death family protein [Treponema primitia ZAS-2]